MKEVPADQLRLVSINIFCEQRSEGLARIVVTYEDTPVAGTIRGPFSKYARTLPSNHPVKDGRCTVVDPCYWTPTLPFFYEVSVVAEDNHGNATTHEFEWGMRWCVPHRTDLWLNGKGFVLRAIECNFQPQVDLTLLREMKCGLIVRNPNEELYRDASETGVMLVDLSKNSTMPFDENRCAAMHFASRGKRESDVLSVSHGGDSSTDAHARIVSEHEITTSLYDRPVFVRRNVAMADIATLRRECDLLQRDMAVHGQFAGYLITTSSSE